jgi:hypothetical protein
MKQTHDVNINKAIYRYKKRVHKQYPGAYAVLKKGGWTIVQEQDDLTQKDILAEYYFTPTSSELIAWELAVVSAKTEQNFNRTHPLRNDAADPKSTNRTRERLQKAALLRDLGQETRKKLDHGNYI